MAVRSAVVLLICLAWLTSACGAERTPWTTSRITGTPEPPLPFKTERVFTDLSFEHPTLLAFGPGMMRMFVGEQGGKLFSFSTDAGSPKKQLVIDLKTAIQFPEKTSLDALYGLAFDPQFAQNRYVYLCYVLRPDAGQTLPEGSRVSRFVMSESEPPTIDAASETILLTYLAGGHNGGCLEFGQDGCLYISTGDGAGPNPPDKLRTGQDCSDFLSSILRIDVRGATQEKPYLVPADNPYLGRDGVRPEIWAFGFRNPWKFTVDRQTGELWVADVGWDQWEMVHLVEKGGNYGWSAMEGRQPLLPDVAVGPAPITPPLIELGHSISASVTGGYVYRGSKFPELRGEYIFGDWETKTVWAAKRDAVGKGVMRDLADSGLQIVAFGEDEAGELYLADYGTGVIHTLTRNVQASQPSTFPKRLSETGLFKDVAKQSPESGVVPFDVNQPQWSDFATAQRWIAVPGTEPIVWHPRDRPIPGSMFQRSHDHPAETVLAKTLSLELEAGKPESSRNIETQILHFDGRTWRAYTYAWNDEQTDAELVPAHGAEKTLTVKDADWAGGQRIHRWTFAGRNQCLACHNPWPQYLLGFTPGQLHRDVTRDGVKQNQLQWLESLGLLKRVDDGGKDLAALADDSLAKTPHHADRDDPNASPSELARSYLHVQCSHCHRDNGGGAGAFQLLKNLSDKDLKVLDEYPKQGNFDLEGGRVVVAGDPARSILYLRMAKFGRGHMPHYATEYVDEKALGWIESWITSLSSEKPPAAAPFGSDMSSEAAIRTALSTARQIGRGELKPDLRDQILASADRNPSALVQDLFAGYQPPERRRETLGSQIQPATIQSRKGDAARGSDLFWKSATLQCRSCHRAGPMGGDVGPNLADVSRTKTTAEILEGILDPSRKVDPKFATYILETKSGRVLSGLLVKKDTDEVVLRDSQGKESRTQLVEVEDLQPTTRSLMPDGLLKDATAQEAADLLQFLVDLKATKTE
jgi:putative heme-binding domain-containing protein